MSSYFAHSLQKSPFFGYCPPPFETLTNKHISSETAQTAKESFVRLILFHGTSTDSVPQILKNGEFKVIGDQDELSAIQKDNKSSSSKDANPQNAVVSRAGSKHTFKKFGAGMYFALDIQTAIFYAKSRKSGLDSGAVLVSGGL